MSISLEQATSSLLRAGLLNDDELESACHQLEQETGTTTADRLLDHFRADGRLTKYQVRRVTQGRSKELVFGNYVLLSRIGVGGMGDVFKALHRRMQRVVALKVIKKKMATEEFIIRFRREIQAAARLNHPHVIAAFDAGECELGDFLVMEFVEGADFKEIVAESGPLSVDEALETVRQAAAGLSYAHQNGIVHRDIKPANLMRDVGGVVKVADLGLARMTDTADGVVESAGLTQTGAVSGTIDYMSPEQAIDSASVDHRADVYSLGCTLYFLLTGEPIFTASSLMGRMLAHRETPPPNLVDEIQGATQELDDLFHDMVQKNPKDRLNSMQDVIDRVESLQGKQSSGKVEQPKWNAEDCAVMLVVESRLQTSMISKMLNETAIQEVHACTSGEEALNRLRVTPVQAVIVSSTLPDMSGVQLCEQIRDELRWSRVAVLMMTSDPLKDGARRTIGRLTGVDVLQKPFDGTKLGNALRQLLTMEVEDHRQLAGLESRRILIVDDSSVARRRVAATLTELGFDDFVENENGADAIQRMRNEEFDLVVTDYNMPIVDGRDLIDWIRNESDQPDIPVIMVTTEFDPLKLAEIYQLGVSAICGKAFEREQVRNIIIRLFM
jgi:serine/threonine protein kinase